MELDTIASDPLPAEVIENMPRFADISTRIDSKYILHRVRQMEKFRGRYWPIRNGNSTCVGGATGMFRGRIYGADTGRRCFL